jgi:hypothetical protein
MRDPRRLAALEPSRRAAAVSERVGHQQVERNLDLARRETSLSAPATALELSEVVARAQRPPARALDLRRIFATPERSARTGTSSRRPKGKERSSRSHA